MSEIQTREFIKRLCMSEIQTREFIKRLCPRFLLGADHTEVPTAWHIPPRKKTSTFIINYTVCTVWA